MAYNNNNNNVISISGFGFWPRDEELVVDYLMRKLNNEASPCEYIIKDVELYDFEEPNQLVASHEFTGGGNKWYFFTRRVKKDRNGSRFERTTTKGCWSGTGNSNFLYGDEIVGKKRCFVFYYNTPDGKGKKTDWLMQEFEVTARLDDWVLCKVYNSKNELQKENKQVVSMDEAVCLKGSPSNATFQEQLDNNNGDLLFSLPVPPQQLSPEEAAIFSTTSRINYTSLLNGDFVNQSHFMGSSSVATFQVQGQFDNNNGAMAFQPQEVPFQGDHLDSSAQMINSSVHNEDLNFVEDLLRFCDQSPMEESTQDITDNHMGFRLTDYPPFACPSGFNLGT